jgi:hypothetical protein
MEGLLQKLFLAAKHLELAFMMMQQKLTPCLQVMEEHWIMYFHFPS